MKLPKKTRSHNTVELLQTEVEDDKRNQKVMKSEIKRLATDNDNLRHTLSSYRGMHRYTTNVVVINQQVHIISLVLPMPMTISPLRKSSRTVIL